MAQGKRAGARRRGANRGVLLALALGVTASFVAWGYLVFAAIDFGATARSGDARSWWFLALASVGAVACLFLTLILISRIGRALGFSRGPASAHPEPDSTSADPRAGRRASR